MRPAVADLWSQDPWLMVSALCALAFLGALSYLTYVYFFLRG